MKITEIKIDLSTNGDAVLAYASVVFDGSLVVKHIRIINTATSVIVSMPSRKRFKNGTTVHDDLVHPINEDFRNYLNLEIFRAYEAKRKRSMSSVSGQAVEI